MEIFSFEIPDVILLRPKLFADPRGWFEESYSLRTMTEAGIGNVFVQDNHSLSQNVGTIRGLHYQIPPHPQGKLVRVVRGAVLDVVVDVRAESPTYGRYVSAELTEKNRWQIWIPAGFAPGFCTLETSTEVVYKVTDYYAPECDRGIRWNDADLGITWPLNAARAFLSDKDRELPAFRDVMPVLF